MERTRTFTWEDPSAAGFAAASGMSGLEFLRAIAAGTIPPPPFGVTLGMRSIQFDEGFAVFGIDPEEYHYNPIGVVHGGVAATLLDSAMSCAIHTTLAAGERYTTLELKVNFTAPITTATGPVRAEGRVVHRGRTVATAEGRVTAEGTGKLLAHGLTTCLLLSAPPAS